MFSEKPVLVSVDVFSDIAFVIKDLDANDWGGRTGTARSFN